VVAGEDVESFKEARHCARLVLGPRSTIGQPQERGMDEPGRGEKKRSSDLPQIEAGWLREPLG